MDARTLKRIKDAESRPLSHPEARAIVLITSACAGWPNAHILLLAAFRSGRPLCRRFWCCCCWPRSALGPGALFPSSTARM